MEEFFQQINTLYLSLQKYQQNKDKLLNIQLNNKNQDELNIINEKMNYINDKINNISDDIESLQYEIDTNQLYKSNDVKQRIKDHKSNQIDKKILDAFFPYIMLTSMLLNSNENI